MYFIPDLCVISLTSLSHLANRARCAGEFITFHLFIYMAYLAMQGFFRTYGLLFVSFDSVFRLATVLPEHDTINGIHDTDIPAQTMAVVDCRFYLVLDECL